MAFTERAYSTLANMLSAIGPSTIGRALQDLVESFYSGSGWASYVDTQDTSESPLAITANTDTVLPNNRGSTITTYLPRDMAKLGQQFVDSNGKITGREGDAILVTMDFIIVPTEQNTTYVETWTNIGGSVGELYRRISTFPKGNGVARQIVHTTLMYTLDTWEANGGTVYIRTNGTANVYNIRYVISRVHRGLASRVE